MADEVKQLPLDKEIQKAQPSFWVAIVVIARVFFTLALALVLFLGMWVGYFTLPLLIIGAVILFYALSDLGLLLLVRQREQSRKEREAFLQEQDDPYRSKLIR